MSTETELIALIQELKHAVERLSEKHFDTLNLAIVVHYVCLFLCFCFPERFAGICYSVEYCNCNAVSTIAMLTTIL